MTDHHSEIFKVFDFLFILLIFLFIVEHFKTNLRSPLRDTKFQIVTVVFSRNCSGDV